MPKFISKIKGASLWLAFLIIEFVDVNHLRAVQIRGEHDDGVSQYVGRIGGREVLVLWVRFEISAREFLHQPIDLLSLTWTRNKVRIKNRQLQQ